MSNFRDEHKDASLEGIVFGTAPANSSSFHRYVMPYDRLFNGIKSFAKDSHMGDNISLRIKTPSVQDADPNNPAHWVLYKKLSKSWFVTPNLICEIVLYPATPSAGVMLEFEYVNVGNVDVQFFINAFFHRERSEQIGVDW